MFQYPGRTNANKEYPHRVWARVHKNEFRELMTWLHEQGLVLHETVMFGLQESDKLDNDYRQQQVRFKDPNKAMSCKLTWAG